MCGQLSGRYGADHRQCLDEAQVQSLPLTPADVVIVVLC
jgi:hypothetical protein